MFKGFTNFTNATDADGYNADADVTNKSENNSPSCKAKTRTPEDPTSTSPNSTVNAILVSTL
jgi:hypothetical protein